MTTGSDPATRRETLRLTARSWASLDAAADNAMSNNAIDGDSQVVLTGGVIRQAGWDQVPWIDGHWPAMTDVISITLTVEQWLFLASRAGVVNDAVPLTPGTSPSSSPR